MDPRTHPRGARPDFTLPKPNPNPTRMTDALWWLVCMRLALEPDSRNGGTLAVKPGYHSYGSRLPDYGQGDSRTDHSIRWSWDRTGPWWRDYCAAHDWTFESAHTGNYTIIAKYVTRLITAMKSLTDLRPDDVYAYTIGQADADTVVEGYNERTDAPESGDDSHLWHRHDSFRRNIVGDYQAMWKALTIDMGWTYAEWQQSVQEDVMAVAPEDLTKIAQAVASKLYSDLTKAEGSGLKTVMTQTERRIVAGVTAANGPLIASVNALGGKDFTDEPAIIAGILAGLDPVVIAAAVPEDLARQVADELATRLQSPG